MPFVVKAQAGEQGNRSSGDEADRRATERPVAGEGSGAQESGGLSPQCDNVARGPGRPHSDIIAGRWHDRDTFELTPDERREMGRALADIPDLGKDVDWSRFAETMRTIGRGDDNLVFASPSYPDIVLKICHFDAAIHYAWNRRGGRAGDNPPSAALLAQAHAGLTAMREDQQQLAERFPGHVPDTRYAFGRCPLPGRILKSQLPEFDIEDRLHDIHMRIAVQPFVKEIGQSGSLDFSLISPEWRDAYPDHEAYGRANDLWILNREGPFDAELFERLHEGSLAELLKTARTDPSLPPVLADLLCTMVALANTDKKVLAYSGDENLLVFKEGGNWNYRLPDALFPPGMNAFTLHDTAAVLTKIDNGEPLASFFEKRALWNGMFSVRAINGMLHGLEELTARRLPRARLPFQKEFSGGAAWTTVRQIGRETPFASTRGDTPWGGLSLETARNIR